MQIRITAALVAILGIGAAQAAEDGRHYLGLMGSYVFPSDVREAEFDDPGAHLLYGFPLNGYPHWTVEVGGYWNMLEPDADGPDDKLAYLGFEVVRHWHTATPLRPFALAGLGAAWEEVAGDDKFHPAVTLGGGLLAPLWRQLDLRLDLRAVAQENDFERDGVATSGRFAFVDGRVNLGLQFALGGWQGTASAPDDCDVALVGLDGLRDDCPSSPRGSEGDADGDGVFDDFDRCPATPTNTPVDGQGCISADSVRLRGVNFHFDSDRLTAQARDILDSVAILLSGSLIDRRIEVAGHTDGIGSAVYNDGLSLRRARAVKRYLVGQGVTADRLVSRGYGFHQPVAGNDSEQGRAANRRVIFTILDSR